ncbi:MAG TPA: hypothetical protein VGC88_02950, partial [Terriglobales bacterium]
MGFLFTLLFIAISYLSLPELFPVLIPFRIELVLALLALAASLPNILKTKPWRLTQTWVWLAFVFSVGLSTLVALHWLGGALIDIN